MPSCFFVYYVVLKVCAAAAFHLFLSSFCKSFNSACRSFLNKNITALTMLKCKQNKVDRFVKTHYKSCHIFISKCDWTALL